MSKWITTKHLNQIQVNLIIKAHVKHLCERCIWFKIFKQQLYYRPGSKTQNRHSNSRKNGLDICLPGGRDKIENTQTCRAAHKLRRERSLHTMKGQPSDIHNTETQGTQHLTERDGRWQTWRREIRGRETEWVDLEMRRRNRVQGCGRAKDSEGEEDRL